MRGFSLKNSGDSKYSGNVSVIIIYLYISSTCYNKVGLVDHVPNQNINTDAFSKRTTFTHTLTGLNIINRCKLIIPVLSIGETSLEAVFQ